MDLLMTADGCDGCIREKDAAGGTLLSNMHSGARLVKDLSI